jgi:phospholysine phosphohistidine inorganic pyrophosphate phosphatase
MQSFKESATKFSFDFLAVVQEFSEFDQSNPNSIVLGDAQDAFTFQRLNTAFQLLMEQRNTKLITMGYGYAYAR